MNLQMNLRPGYVFTKLINKKGFFYITPPERDDKQLMKGEKSKKKKDRKKDRGIVLSLEACQVGRPD